MLALGDPHHPLAADSVDWWCFRVCSREASGPRPTVITPHGGPHSAYMAQYFMPLTFLVSLGGCCINKCCLAARLGGCSRWQWGPGLLRSRACMPWHRAPHDFNRQQA